MSLEQAIADNTAAIRELIAALANKPVAVAADTTPSVDVLFPAPAKGKKVKQAEPPDFEDVPVKVEPPAPAPAPAPAVEEIPYSVVTELVLLKAKTHGKEVKAILLADYGASSARGLTPDQYPGFIDKLNQLKD